MHSLQYRTTVKPGAGRNTAADGAFLVVCGLLVLGLVEGCSTNMQTPPEAAGTGLKWKAVWVWGIPHKTRQDALKYVLRAAELGFNVVIEDGSDEFRRGLVSHAHEHRMQAFLELNAIYGEWGWKQFGDTEVPTECLQKYPAEELERLHNPGSPDRVAYKGPFLCIDRPEVRTYAAALAAYLAETYHPDGIALDYIGYKNYQGCKCPFSMQKQCEFIAAHTELSAEEAAKQFSLRMIEKTYQEVKQAVQTAAPGTLLHCHAYPPFDPEPLYGNRLPVDYPAQTVSWYFKPHWTMDQVRTNCLSIMSNEKKYHDCVTATAFIALSLDEECRKPPERLRSEIRAVRDAGIRAVLIGGPASFMQDPGIARVLAEELNGSLVTAERGSSAGTGKN